MCMHKTIGLDFFNLSWGGVFFAQKYVRVGGSHIRTTKHVRTYSCKIQGVEVGVGVLLRVKKGIRCRWW